MPGLLGWEVRGGPQEHLSLGILRHVTQGSKGRQGGSFTSYGEDLPGISSSDDEIGFLQSKKERRGCQVGAEFQGL